MINRLVSIALLLMIAVPSVVADDNVCPCVPLSKVWVTTSCETWNCAQSAMILANGDPYALAVPTGDSKYGEVVIRRVVAGSVTAVPEDPFAVTSYTAMNDAIAGFVAADPNTFPLLMTAMDGSTLLVKLRQPAPGRRRAASR